MEGEVLWLYQVVLTWKKHVLQQRGRPGGRGLLLPLVPPLSSMKAWSRASSRSTILTADTNGVGFCRARARALLTTAHSSLPAVTHYSPALVTFINAAKTQYHSLTAHLFDIHIKYGLLFFCYYSLKLL